MHATVEREKPRDRPAKAKSGMCGCGATGHACACSRAPAQRSASAGGSPLAPAVAGDMSNRLGHDFSKVRVHTDTRAAEAAAREGALAFTVGQNIYFGSGQYRPEQSAGRRLLAHELIHTLQQRDSAPRDDRDGWRSSGTGSHPRWSRMPADPTRERALEGEAERFAASAERGPRARADVTRSAPVQTLTATHESIARTRTPLPSPIPLCGKTLTDIEIEPPRPRPLEPCKPPTVLVTRMNIIGRDATSPSGKNQVFNLHLGFYTDPVTGRLCAIADDSKSCVCPRCVELGCFSTMREVLDALVEFATAVLVVLGIALLAWIIAEIIAAIATILAGAALLLASGGGTNQSPGPGGGAPDSGAVASGGPQPSAEV